MIVFTGTKKAKLIVHFSYPTIFGEKVTHCQVKSLRYKRVMGTGTSLKNPKDKQFFKTVGRKHAFARALKKVRLSKAQRRNAWKSYFSQTKSLPA